MELSNEDFNQLTRYVRQNYGIDLSKKKQLIESRLTKMLENSGYQNFHPYVGDITSGRRPDLILPTLSRITTNYTYFEREREHFVFLNSTVLPELEKRHRTDHSISIWSAGCSSGEEPYTISLYLLEYFSKLPGTWDTRILATDISDEVLAQAQNPVYTDDRLAALPGQWKKRYFLDRPDGSYTVTRQLRQNVIFRRFNLMDPIQFQRRFDVIFCRNVMIYFDQQTKDSLVKRFYDATVPGGYLFIGHSESLTKSNCPYDYLKPAIYRKS
jgi:chemotaxis protein methyltransferase CheR